MPDVFSAQQQQPQSAESQPRPAVDLEGIRARQYGRHSEYGPRPGQVTVSAVAFLIARNDIDGLLTEVDRLRTALGVANFDRLANVEKAGQLQVELKQCRQQLATLRESFGLYVHGAETQLAAAQEARDRFKAEWLKCSDVVVAARRINGLTRITKADLTQAGLPQALKRMRPQIEPSEASDGVSAPQRRCVNCGQPCGPQGHVAGNPPAFHCPEPATSAKGGK